MTTNGAAAFAPGDRVHSEDRGPGSVLKTEDTDRGPMLTVRFDEDGYEARMLAMYAHLTWTGTGPPPPSPPRGGPQQADEDDAIRAAGLELDAFLNTTPPDYDWLVPGLIERRDRTIVTAGEGHGKSTWLRQMGVQFASGIHPFGGEDFKPLRVLLFDLENSERQVHRKIRPLRAQAGNRYGGGMVIRVRPEGLDFGQGDGQLLEAEVAAAAPDVLIIGPLYRLADEDSDNPARAAKIAMAWLDKMRVTYDCALFIEAHSPHGEGGKKRPTRPYGSSQWLRWPEFGIHLAETGIITHWRGARDERDWPAAVQRGGEWPWSTPTRPRDVVWARIVQLCTEAGGQLSERVLAAMTGSSQATVHRTIKEHEAEWNALESAGQEGESRWQ